MQKSKLTGEERPERRQQCAGWTIYMAHSRILPRVEKTKLKLKLELKLLRRGPTAAGPF